MKNSDLYITATQLKLSNNAMNKIKMLKFKRKSLKIVLRILQVRSHMFARRKTVLSSKGEKIPENPDQQRNL